MKNNVSPQSLFNPSIMWIHYQLCIWSNFCLFLHIKMTLPNSNITTKKHICLLFLVCRRGHCRKWQKLTHLFCVKFVKAFSYGLLRSHHKLLNNQMLSHCSPFIYNNYKWTTLSLPAQEQVQFVTADKRLDRKAPSCAQFSAAHSILKSEGTTKDKG